MDNFVGDVLVLNSTDGTSNDGSKILLEDGRGIEVENSKLSPGNQLKHYSPNKPLRINAEFVNNNEVLLNYGKNNLFSNIKSLNLSTKEN